jgi:hypothetical protein
VKVSRPVSISRIGSTPRLERRYVHEKFTGKSYRPLLLPPEGRPKP